METAKDRPEKDPEPIGDPVPEPAPRDDVLAKASPVRCPFCHTDVRVDVDAWVACRGCLARHHVACWQERGACSACGTTAALNATVLGELTPRSARPAGSRNLSIAAFGLIAFVGLFGLLLLGVGAWLATARGRVERTTPAPVFAEQPTYTPPRPADARYWDAIRPAPRSRTRPTAPTPSARSPGRSSPRRRSSCSWSRPAESSTAAIARACSAPWSRAPASAPWAWRPS